MRLAFLPALALLAGVSADFIDGLPKCWQSCVSKADSNCDGWDLPCICKAGQGDFLTSTVSCARANCGSDDFDVQLFLAPMELLCAAVGTPLPAKIIRSAENCATAKITSTKPSTAKTTGKAASSKKGTKSQNYITSTYTTAITETTTDAHGSTVWVVIPLVVEPSTIITGKPSTAVPTDAPSDSTTLESVVVSPSPVESTTPPPSDTAAAQTATSTSSSKPKSTDNSGGSPFSNPQAAASTVSSSWLLGVFGLLLALF